MALKRRAKRRAKRRVTCAVMTVSAALVLTGCTSDDTSGGNGAGVGAEPDVRLSVSVRPDVDQAARSATLTCKGDTSVGTGYLAEAKAAIAACEAVREEPNRRRLVEGPPVDQVCTEIFGGLEQASVTGTIQGQNVDATLDRANGCGIADWDQLRPLLEPTPKS